MTGAEQLGDDDNLISAVERFLRDTREQPGPMSNSTELEKARGVKDSLGEIIDGIQQAAQRVGRLLPDYQPTVLNSNLDVLGNSVLLTYNMVELVRDTPFVTGVSCTVTVTQREPASLYIARRPGVPGAGNHLPEVYLLSLKDPPYLIGELSYLAALEANQALAVYLQS